MRVAISFVAGILFFLSVALLLGAFVSTQIQPAADTEGIISKTSIAGYPKYLDGRYFNLASFLVPVSAWLFWLWVGRKWKMPHIALLSVVWLAIVIFAVLKQ